MKATVLFLSAFFVLALLPAGTAAAETPDDGTEAPGDETLAEEDAEALERELAARLDDGAPLGELRIDSECRDEEDGGLRAITVHGDGFGVWSHRRQIHLEETRIRRLLEAFRRAGFVHLDDVYGGRPETTDPGKPGIQRQPPEPSGGAAVRVTCWVELTLDGASKRVLQRYQGEQSPALRELASTLFELCAGPAEDGVVAADLADGLSKVAEGVLDPRTFSLVLHRKPELTAQTTHGAAEEEAGWLLRLHGREATVRPYDDRGKLGDEVTRTLAGATVAGLAQLLLDNRAGELPGNLWAPSYTDFSVRVLDRSHRLQARRFAGMTPESHGEKQERFDDVFQVLASLALGLLEGGGFH